MAQRNLSSDGKRYEKHKKCIECTQRAEPFIRHFLFVFLWYIAEPEIRPFHVDYVDKKSMQMAEESFVNGKYVSIRVIY